MKKLKEILMESFSFRVKEERPKLLTLSDNLLTGTDIQEMSYQFATQVVIALYESQEIVSNKEFSILDSIVNKVLNKKYCIKETIGCSDSYKANYSYVENKDAGYQILLPLCSGALVSRKKYNKYTDINLKEFNVNDLSKIGEVVVFNKEESGKNGSYYVNFKESGLYYFVELEIKGFDCFLNIRFTANYNDDTDNFSNQECVAIDNLRLLTEQLQNLHTCALSKDGATYIDEAREVCSNIIDLKELLDNTYIKPFEESYNRN